MGFVVPKKARPGDPIVAGRGPQPQAPGAITSPQVPGKVPDRSSVPGEGVLPVEVPEATPRRPMTEYGTAQRIMGVYTPKDGNDDAAERFELGPISYEEQRKAYPALRTPLRPKHGYALADGTRASSKLAEVAAESETPEIAPGE